MDATRLRLSAPRTPTLTALSRAALCLAPLALAALAAPADAASPVATTPAAVTPAAVNPAAEQDVELTYSIYAAGLKVVHLVVEASIAPTGYGMSIGFTTTGLYGALFSGSVTTNVQGRWEGRAASPILTTSQGHWRGQPRDSRIEYHADIPTIVRLVPPLEPERIPVPASEQAHTIDTLSAIALLVHRVATENTCDGAATIYDGRRLSSITAKTVGQDTVPESSRSDFHGPALRCDFSGRLLGGYMRDDDPARVSRPKRGSAWLAPLQPGGAPLPVRLSFETTWFGDATMYLESYKFRPAG